MNILLCIDDFKGDYTRHCAVTILSLLETNKNHKIKFFIMSSCIPEENMDELSRIVKLYNQEIEFIIRDNFIPEKLKTIFINRRNLTRGTRYRLFFTDYIKGIDRLLYLDCDIIVNKDISDFYNMDMKGKIVTGNSELDVIKYYKKKQFGIDNYVNAGVLLFDVDKFKNHPITTTEIEKINKQFNKRLDDADQDYLNIVYKNEIGIYPGPINYFCIKPFFNKHLKSAMIYHCLAKPHIKHSNCPKYVIRLYYHYLDKTKWKGYPKNNRSLVYYIYALCYQFMISCFSFLFGVKGGVFVDYIFRKFERCLTSLFHVKKYSIG